MKIFFSEPVLVSSRQDLNRLLERLRELDIGTYAIRQRPNTKYKPIMITNIVYRVYRMSFVLGNGRKMPDYIRNSKSIICFEKKSHFRQTL